MLRLCILAVAPLIALGQDAFPIASIEVRGNGRFSTEAVVRASGLSIGERVTPDEIEAACNRLIGTGLILGARYQFKPAPGKQAFAVTLEIQEADDLYDIRIDVPGVEEAAAWKWLEENDGLALSRGPTTSVALDYYKAAIERFLHENGRPVEVASSLRSDFRTGSVYAIFRPTVLETIREVKFEGASGIPVSALDKAIAPAIGSDYTEQDFRELLEFNVRPVYEDAAYYRVSFPKVTMENGTVTVMVSEGPVFRLGAAQIAGERPPVPEQKLAKMFGIAPGQPAGWFAISSAANEMASAIRRLGYLDADCVPERELDASSQRVDIYFIIRAGQQYMMGNLGLEGLDAASEARARSLWQLRSGAPLDMEYVDRFERAIMRDGRVRFKRVRLHLNRRPGSNVADMLFAFEH